MSLILILASTAVAATTPGKRPSAFESYKLARWLFHENAWGFAATISNGHSSGSVGTAWANEVSYSDGIYNSTDPKLRSTGTPYFLLTTLDETAQDIALNPMGSFAVSEAQLSNDQTCIKTDAEDPTCARISVTGKFVDVTANGTAEEEAFGLKALYSKHPEMAEWPTDHDFHVYKLEIISIFFLGFYGGSAPLKVDKYFDTEPPLAVTNTKSSAVVSDVATAKPPVNHTAAVARWLVQQTVYGTIATISNGHDSGTVGNAFANPQSFSDGIKNSTDPKQQSTGIPYFLMTGLDETPQDLVLNPMGGLGISEAQIVGDPICAKTDQEDPQCARISFAGKFVDITLNGTAAEQAFGLKALYSKHPEMPEFGQPGKGDHDFHVWKLEIHHIFFLDDYGGASPMSTDAYFAASPSDAFLTAPPAESTPCSCSCWPIHMCSCC